MASVAIGKKRVRMRREDRMAELIQAATDIFTNEGCAELTLRRVAKDQGIRLSTVQYYFESREGLVKAVLNSQVAGYKKSLVEFKEAAVGDPLQQLSSYIQFLLDDIDNPQSCKFFTQLWAMGFQKADSCEILSHTYDTHRQDLASLIQAATPCLDELEYLKRATIISSIIEGSLVHMGHGLPVKPEFAGIRERLLSLIMAIAIEGN